MERAVSFLQQEDDFNQLVIIANTTFDIQNQYNQNENKQITLFHFQELNEKVLDVIVNEIFEELKSRTILLIVDDAEWKMVENFARVINLEHDRLFLARLTLMEGRKLETEPCLFEMSSNDLRWVSLENKFFTSYLIGRKQRKVKQILIDTVY